MRPALGQTGSNFSHEIRIQNLFYGLAVEIAQHVGVAGTASFDVTTGIDVQAAPGCRTIKIAHAVFTALCLTPRRFGFAKIFSSKTIGNQTLTQTATI